VNNLNLDLHRLLSVPFGFGFWFWILDLEMDLDLDDVSGFVLKNFVLRNFVLMNFILKKMHFSGRFGPKLSRKFYYLSKNFPDSLGPNRPQQISDSLGSNRP
jgi:hypothetical protein